MGKERKATLGNEKLERVGDLCKQVSFLVADTDLEYNDGAVQQAMVSARDALSELIEGE